MNDDVRYNGSMLMLCSLGLTDSTPAVRPSLTRQPFPLLCVNSKAFTYKYCVLAIMKHSTSN